MYGSRRSRDLEPNPFKGDCLFYDAITRPSLDKGGRRAATPLYGNIHRPISKYCGSSSISIRRVFSDARGTLGEPGRNISDMEYDTSERRGRSAAVRKSDGPALTRSDPELFDKRRSNL